MQVRAQMQPTAYDEYVNANRGKLSKGKAKQGDGNSSAKPTSSSEDAQFVD